MGFLHFEPSADGTIPAALRRKTDGTTTTNRLEAVFLFLPVAKLATLKTSLPILDNRRMPTIAARAPDSWRTSACGIKPGAVLDELLDRTAKLRN